MTDAIKKYREVLAYCLLGVAALYLLAGLSLLFKSEDDFGLEFTGRAAAVGNLFAHPLLIAALVLAIAVIAFGEPSRQARTVVLVALGIVAVSLLLGVICWLSALGSDETPLAGGVFGAGKIVGALLGLAQLVFLAATALFGLAVLQSLPKPAVAGAGGAWSPQPGWGQPDPAQQGWGQPEPAQQGWGGQYDPNNPGYGQQQWGQPGYAQTAAPQQGWAQPSAGQQGYPPPPAGQDWGQPASPQQGYDQAAGQATWQPPEPQAEWGQPQAEWGQPQQQWGAAPYSGGEPAGGGWGEQPAQQGWAHPAEASPEEASPDEQSVPADDAHTGATAADESAAAPSTATDGEGEPEPPGGWWQRPQQ